jgi:hypothetical protein
MKAIKTALIINSIRSKKDKSLGFSAETPELTPEEAIEFMQLQGTNLIALLEPTDFKVDEIKIKADLDLKTPSERLRSVIYVYFKKLQEQGKSIGDFRDFYDLKMEKLINIIKTSIEEI